MCMHAQLTCCLVFKTSVREKNSVEITCGERCEIIKVGMGHSQGMKIDGSVHVEQLDL